MDKTTSAERVVACIQQDVNGRVTGWNAEAERLLGWTAAEAIGMHSHAFIPPRNHQRHDRALQQVLAAAEDTVYEREITAVHRDGHEFQMRVTLARQHTPSGNHLLVRATPIEQRARAAEAFSRPDRYRAILDQIEDGCCVVDLRGNYLYVNDAFCAMFNYDKAQITGANFKDTTGEARVKTIRHVYNEVYRTRQPIKAFEYEVFPKDRPPMFIEQSVSLEHDEQGRPIGFLSISRDCTARKHADRALEEARAAAEQARATAEEANRAKSDFLANMSHEIRTPMNGIIGMTSLALDTDLTPYQADCIHTVRASAESLLTILNDILDFSKIESHKLELESVSFSLLEALDDALKPLAVRADQKGLELIIDVAPDVPIQLMGDPVRLRQIVTNLVGNAVKFTAHGHVVAAVDVDTGSDESIALHFRVTDTGIGIAPDKVPTIFDPFTQADSSTTRQFGGTGLGLAISSTLVHLMGGRIWVESELGTGSAFHFTAAFDVPSTCPRREPPDAIADVHVLVIDDNEVNRRILTAQLSAWKLRPVAVESGSAGLDALTEAARSGDPFRLVVLDANMPVMDGFSVAAEVQRRPECRGTTMMMLSSSGLETDIRRCRQLGIETYLTKPIKGPELLDAVGRTLGAARARRRAVPPAPMDTLEAPVSVSSQEPATHSLRVLVAEDNVVNQRVATGLLSKRGHAVTVVQNGREALECLERETFDVVLMDVQMPVMGGYEATVAIRERERHTGHHQRIIAMTAHAMNGDRERCIAAGMDGYLSKPLDVRMLRSVVESDPAMSVAPIPLFDHSTLTERLAGDEQLVLDVIRLFMGDCPVRLAAIKVAVDARDADQIRLTAHALKGAAGNLAATGLFEAAQTLERIGAEHRIEAAAAAWKRLMAEATNVLDALHRFETSRDTPVTRGTMT